jgi:spore maturation protein SpmA
MEDIANIVALRRASYQDRPPVKSAILAVAAPAYGVARMFAALMESSPIEVRVFRTVEEAAHWLGVPVAALRADSVGLGHAAQPHP